jgi:GNAT superfamily N-acetyltransferase
MSKINIIHLKPNAQTLESWVAMIDKEVVGHIYMLREEGQKIKFLDAWVHPNHRRKGIFRMLWETRWDYVRDVYNGWIVYAWCKDSSLPLLLEKGFEPGEVSTYVEKKVD